jgi:uncharacterized protein YpbB
MYNILLKLFPLDDIANIQQIDIGAILDRVSNTVLKHVATTRAAPAGNDLITAQRCFVEEINTMKYCTFLILTDRLEGAKYASFQRLSISENTP